MLSSEAMRMQMDKQWIKREEKVRIRLKLLEIHDTMYQDGLLTTEESHKVLEVLDGVIYE